MTSRGDKPPDDRPDERRRQFEESRGLRGRQELPLDEDEEDENEDDDEAEEEESSDDDEPDEEQDET
jgi:hypothetical protein